MIYILGRTSLDEGSACRRKLYRTAHNIQKKEREIERQASMPQAGFEHAIPASERPQTYALG